MKTLIYVGLFVGSTVGGWLGAVVAHGNWLSVWSVLGDTIGAFAGIWAGYKASQYF
jgi:hypothetical protein